MRLPMYLVVACSLTAIPAAAQRLPPLQPGTRIRYAVAPDNEITIARLLTQHADSLWVRVEPTGPNSTLATSSLTRLEVSRGERDHLRAGVGLGFLAGAVIGAASALAEPASSVHVVVADVISVTTNDNRSRDAVIGAVALGTVGAIVGGFIGAHYRTDRWQVVLGGAR